MTTADETLEALARRVWRGETPGARTVRAALAPAAAVYGTVVALRNRLYDAGWLAARRLPAAVVSVGNLSVGGTGKTPAALWVAERLAARGRRVGIVARGYRKRQRGVVVAGEGGTPLVTAAEGGDEAVMLARRFVGPVVTGEDRGAAAAFACAHYALDTVVLDDGFQHRALARDADLVLAGDEAGGARLLPAGPLREPPSGLVRARALLAVDIAPPHAPGIPIFRGRLRPTALVRPAEGPWAEEPLAWLRGRTVVVVTGVARPERVAAAVTASGAIVRRWLRFPDHHAYGPRDAARLAAAAGADPLVTTEKDLVKLEALGGLPTVAALRVALEVDDGDALVDLLCAGPDAVVDLHGN